MSSKMVRLRLFTVLLVLLWGSGWLLSSLWAEEAERYFAGLLQVRLTDAPISAQAVERLVEEEGSGGSQRKAAYSAWTEKRGVELESSSLGKRVKSAVLYVCGDYDNRFGILEGGGCALTENLAFDLFGTIEIAGQTVSIDGRSYAVERVLSQAEEAWTGGAVIAGWEEPAESGDTSHDSQPEMRFDVLDIRSTSEAFSLEELLQGRGFTETVHMDYQQRIDRVNRFRSLPLWVAVLWIMGKLIAQCNRQRKNLCQILAIGKKKPAWSTGATRTFNRYRFYCGAKAMGAAVCAAGVLWLGIRFIGSPFLLPETLVPSTWSDFSFWADTAERMLDERAAWASIGRYAPDGAFLHWTVPIYVISVLQAVVLWVALEQGWKRRMKWRQWN